MGRWWSLWGASDLVPMRKVVCQVAPTLFVPVKAATTEQVVTGRDSGVVQKASAYASPGQPVRGVRLLVRCLAIVNLAARAWCTSATGQFGARIQVRSAQVSSLSGVISSP